MDLKYNLQNLSEVISNKKQMSRKDAETFARIFFDIVGQYLVQDKIVKIKGFGSFKLVDVQDRESVDVNTGERIVIKGHTKVTFTPENSLRDQVNKPFADFDTVIINDGTDIKAMEDMGGAEVSEVEGTPAETPEEKQTQDVIKEEADAEKEKQNIVNIGETSEQEVEKELQMEEEPAAIYEVQEKHPEPEPASIASPKDAVDEEGVLSQNGIADVKCASPSGRGEKRGIYKPIGWMLASVALMLLSYYAGYYRILCPCQNERHPVVVHTPAQKQSKKATKEIAKNSQAISSKHGQPDTIPTAVKPSKPIVNTQQIDRYPQVPGGNYLIVGQKATHIMKKGDNLYRISRKFYGDYRGVKYISCFNSFDNPDVIPPGYKIKIPELRKTP